MKRESSQSYLIKYKVTKIHHMKFETSQPYTSLIVASEAKQGRRRLPRVAKRSSSYIHKWELSTTHTIFKNGCRVFG